MVSGQHMKTQLTPQHIKKQEQSWVDTLQLRRLSPTLRTSILDGENQTQHKRTIMYFTQRHQEMGN